MDKLSKIYLNTRKINKDEILNLLIREIEKANSTILSDKVNIEYIFGRDILSEVKKTFGQKIIDFFNSSKSPYILMFARVNSKEQELDSSFQVNRIQTKLFSDKEYKLRSLNIGEERFVFMLIYHEEIDKFKLKNRSAREILSYIYVDNLNNPLDISRVENDRLVDVFYKLGFVDFEDKPIDFKLIIKKDIIQIMIRDDEDAFLLGGYLMNKFKSLFREKGIRIYLRDYIRKAKGYIFIARFYSKEISKYWYI